MGKQSTLERIGLRLVEVGIGLAANAIRKRAQKALRKATAGPSELVTQAELDRAVAEVDTAVVDMNRRIATAIAKQDALGWTRPNTTPSNP